MTQRAMVLCIDSLVISAVGEGVFQRHPTFLEEIAHPICWHGKADESWDKGFSAFLPEEMLKVEL